MKAKAALFDLDGTLIDSEPQYTDFWVRQGIKYCKDPELGLKIKGSTLAQIITHYFPADDAIQKQIVKDLDIWESEMNYDYVAGAKEFIKDLKRQGLKMAIVTSSGKQKMRHVFKCHPEIIELFDEIIMAEDYSQSKPDPECFLLAARRLGIDAQHCIVFEDSHFGLEAARKAGIPVIGLSTTLPAEEIDADLIIPDYQDFTCEKLNCLLGKM